MTPLALLCEIIAHGGDVSAEHYRQYPALAALQRFGFLSEAGVAASIVCNECDEAHSAPVIHEAGSYGYFCPDIGFVQLAPESLGILRPAITHLIKQLADAFGCSRRRDLAIDGNIWRIGSVETHAGGVMLYFHPTLNTEEDARDLQSALGREVRSEWRLVITAEGAMPLNDAVPVHLGDLVEMNAETGDLHPTADPGILAGVPQKNPGGRPSPHGPILKQLINDRTRTGATVEGLNAEARAVMVAFKEKHPEMPAPSDTTIKRHLRASRTGS